MPGRFPGAVRTPLARLAEGGFLDRHTNVCLFANPGTGKTHCMAALANELVHQGRSVLLTSVGAVVERLLEAKRDLSLTREFRRLDRIDCLAFDDIGYVQHDRAEMEVLFTLLAERYERRSVMLTSNLVCSHWDQLFEGPDDDGGCDRRGGSPPRDPGACGAERPSRGGGAQTSEGLKEAHADYGQVIRNRTGRLASDRKCQVSPAKRVIVVDQAKSLRFADALLDQPGIELSVPAPPEAAARTTARAPSPPGSPPHPCSHPAPGVHAIGSTR